MEAPVIQEYISKGWRLSEFSKAISSNEKSTFLKLLGADNLIILDEIEFQKKWKARILISPMGIEILTLYFMPVAGTA